MTFGGYTQTCCRTHVCNGAMTLISQLTPSLLPPVVLFLTFAVFSLK